MVVDLLSAHWGNLCRARGMEGVLLSSLAVSARELPSPPPPPLFRWKVSRLDARLVPGGWALCIHCTLLLYSIYDPSRDGDLELDFMRHLITTARSSAAPIWLCFHRHCNTQCGRMRLSSATATTPTVSFVGVVRLHRTSRLASRVSREGGGLPLISMAGAPRRLQPVGEYPSRSGRVCTWEQGGSIAKAIGLRGGSGGGGGGGGCWWGGGAGIRRTGPGTVLRLLGVADDDDDDDDLLLPVPCTPSLPPPSLISYI